MKKIIQVRFMPEIQGWLNNQKINPYNSPHQQTKGEKPGDYLNMLRKHFIRCNIDS